MSRLTKISSAIIFGLMLIVILYFAVNLEDQTIYQIDVIEISGDRHLSGDEYLKFANLDDRSKYSELNFTVIKNRIEKHPYIKAADVVYDGDGHVTIELEEKNFEALLFENDEQFIVTENFECVPILPLTKYVDYPVISDPKLRNKINRMKIIRNEKDIKLAFRIISGMKLINAELYENLSEVNLRKGGDIILYFTAFDYPVVLGRGKEIQKIYYFSEFWKEAHIEKLGNELEYIDLRYNKKIFIGSLS